MSRETDTSSSGPKGRGGTAYPSGTPPYGSPREAGGGGAPAQPEEKKTETTLTTRIRINIPGSRPIPPVVVRKPVNGDGRDADADAGGSEQEGPAERTARTPRPDVDEPRPAAGGEQPTSDWFAPRKAPAPEAPPAAGAPHDPAQEHPRRSRPWTRPTRHGSSPRCTSGATTATSPAPR
ncbi:hypothetical protein AB0A99_17535, partial [Streptomyces fradiae]